MELDYELAKRARQVGIPGMTRLHDGYHRVKGTYDMCMDWFRDEGMFIGVELADNAYTCKAIMMSTKQVVQESTHEDYYVAIAAVLEELVNDLPINKKVKM